MAWACVVLVSAPAHAGSAQTDPSVRATGQEQLALGNAHTCAIDAGDVRCWGANESGELGYGNTDDIGDDEPAASAGVVDIGGKAIAIAAGLRHTCVIRSDGQVLCWGDGLNGKLGYGNTDSIGDDETPASVGPVPLGRRAVSIAAGDEHTCALLNTGEIRCWGSSLYGQLGYGNTASIGDNELPTSVPGVTLGAAAQGQAVAVVAGAHHTCALLATGRVRCWGQNSSGQLGRANTSSIYGSLLAPYDPQFGADPVEFPDGRHAVSLTAGRDHTCAVLDDGLVSCWGEGSSGQLGYGNTADIGDNEAPSAAGTVVLDHPAISVSAGNLHTCAILDTGATRCWGSGNDGRLGRGNTSTVLNPTYVNPISLGNEVIAIESGRSHTCARLADGGIRCWGAGSFGRLGYGNTDSIGDDELPSSVAELDLGVSPYPTALASGDAHTCALISNGEVRCWGANDFGQLGYGNTNAVGDDEDPSTAGAVALGNEAKAIAAGASHTCAVLVNGLVRCWGNGGSGRLGLANTDSIGDDETPDSVASVQFGERAVAIGAGSLNTCALTSSGSVRCWGTGANGRLGDPYSTADIGDDEHPSTVDALNFDGTGGSEPGLPKALTVGNEHACVILSDGSLRCWGKGGDGRLGYGNTQDVGDNEYPGAWASGTAHPVNLGANLLGTQIVAGHRHTCVRLDDGNVRCWGEGSYGRLGYANTQDIGDNEDPNGAPVQLGSLRFATMLSASSVHSCAALDDGNVRCWGYNDSGQLGYNNATYIGDNEQPTAAGPIAFGSDRKVTALSSGGSHTCAILDDTSVTCWGTGTDGRLGYGDTDDVGTAQHPVGQSVDLL
jgi:alpha-tubulin suppressor-like RCC1 family protein